MSAALNEQIAPEIVQAIIAKATARGLSVNDYLRQELGLTNGNGVELTVDEGAPPQRNEAMLAALQESEQILNDMPVRGSTEETLNWPLQPQRLHDFPQSNLPIPKNPPPSQPGQAFCVRSGNREAAHSFF